MSLVTINGELYHYGVLGMKWGRRKARGHAGPGRYVTAKRQLAGDKRDLNALNKGGHLSYGITKKRQERFDKRDRAALEKRIAKNEASLVKKEAVDTRSDDAKTAAKIKKKKVSEMSNQELRTINERTRLEQEYSRLNPNMVKKGTKIVAATAATMGTVMNLYNNSDKLVNLGSKLVKKYTKK